MTNEEFTSIALKLCDILEDKYLNKDNDNCKHYEEAIKNYSPYFGGYIFLKDTIENIIIEVGHVSDIKADLECYGIKDNPDFHFCFDDIIKVAEIRSDWEKALSSVDKGYELSGPIGYGFSERDIKNLAILHRDKAKLREKIEELLEDCNFHQETDDFSNGKYDKYIKEQKDIERD